MVSKYNRSLSYGDIAIAFFINTKTIYSESAFNLCLWWIFCSILVFVSPSYCIIVIEFIVYFQFIYPLIFLSLLLSIMRTLMVYSNKFDRKKKTV